MVSSMVEPDPSLAEFSAGTLFWMFLGTLALAPLAFGALGSLVYGGVGSPRWFLILGAGLAVLFSVLAAVSRTPMIGLKIVMNFAVGIVLGILVPLLNKGWPDYLASF